MKKIIQQFYFTISYNGINETVIDPKEKDFTILINQYLFLIAIIFLLHGIFTISYVGYGITSFLMIGISILFLLLFAIPKNLIKNNLVISTILCVLTIIVTFYSSYCGFESGIFLFYFPIITSIFIFFSWHTSKYHFIFLLLFTLSTAFISICYDFKLINRNDIYDGLKNKLFTLNACYTLLLLILNSCFIKLETYYFVLNRNGFKKKQIENLNNEILRLQTKLNKDLYSEENLKELIDLIPFNENFFLEKFEIYFPDFFEKLNNLSESPLSIPDLKTCAMLKLGFTAKQIAIYSNSSIRSADGRIYRIRKKLNLSSDVDSKTWFKEL